MIRLLEFTELCRCVSQGDCVPHSITRKLYEMDAIHNKLIVDLAASLVSNSKDEICELNEFRKYI